MSEIDPFIYIKGVNFADTYCKIPGVNFHYYILDNTTITTTIKTTTAETNITKSDTSKFNTTK